MSITASSYSVIGMDPLVLLELKSSLIASKGPTFISDLEAQKIWSFQKILVVLQESNLDEDDSLQVLCCDILSIWLLRYTQALRATKVEEIQKNHIFSSDDANTVFQYIVNFLEQGSGPFVNALNSLLFKIIDTCKYSYANTDTVFQNWITLIMQIPKTSRVFYSLLEIIAKQLTSTQYILDSYPSLPQNTMYIMWSDALANSASKALAVIYKGVNTKDANFGIRLLKSLVFDSLQNVELRKNIQTYLLPLLFNRETFPEFMEYFSSKLNISSNLEDFDLQIGIAKVGQELAIVNEPFDPNLPDQIIPFDLLLTTMQHKSPIYRIRSFALFVGSPKNSQEIPSYILHTLQTSPIIQSFFMDYEDTDIRNDFSSYMRNFFIRIRDSSYAANRDLAKLRKKSIDEPKQQYLQTYLDSLKEFLTWSVDLLKGYITPGSNYVQSSLGLQLFEYLIDLGLDKDVNISRISATPNKKTSSEFPFFIEIFDDFFIHDVFQSITSNYEDIREKSSNVLLLCPSTKLNYIFNDSKLIEECFHILSDLKGRKSEGGACIFQFLVKARQADAELGKPIRTFEFIHLLTSRIDKVLSTMTTISDSDFVAPKDRVHGIFSALRLILNGLTSDVYKKNKSFWSSIFTKIAYHQYTKVWTLVKPILANTMGDLNDVDDGKLVLNYSWKVVKESTTLIQSILEISLRHDIPIEEDIFLKIVQIVMDQLSSINHRGAFSSVYPTFITCCELCLDLKSDFLVQKPKEWLEQNIQVIEFKTQYISRRSGGLPYLITGILTALKCTSSKNKDKSRDGNQPFDFAMNELIRISSIPYIPNADEKMDIPQVHAFNSLKHIFIDSQLSTESIYYLKDALKLALLNCDSKTWAIRNCSVMLFTALQNKFFGSNKLGDILPTLNANSFFHKYPGIEDILYDILCNTDSKIESVFPVLTILMRLEDLSSGVLEKFEPPLYQKLQHRDWKVREISARALAGILRPQQFESQCTKLLHEILDGKCGRNRRHGNLLTILEIIKRINLRLPNEVFSPYCVQLLTSNVSKFIVVRKGITFEWASNKTFINILQEIENLSLSLDTFLYIANYITKRLVSTNGERVMGLEQLMLQDMIKLILEQHLMSKQYQDCLEAIRLCIHIPEAYEVQLVAITFFESHINTFAEKNRSMLLMLTNDLWSQIISNENCWSPVKSSALNLFQKLVEVINLDTVFSMESLLSATKLLHEYIETNLYGEDVTNTALRALGPLTAQLINTRSVEITTVLLKFYEHTRVFSQDDQTFNNRMSVISSLSSFMSKAHPESDPQLISEAVVRVKFFLWDDDRDIRDLATETLSKYFNLENALSNISITAHFMNTFEVKLNNEVVESILVSALCDARSSVSQSLNLYNEKEQDIHSLFDIESDNLYKNDCLFHEQICTMLRKYPKLLSLSAISVSEMMKCDIIEVTRFVNQGHVNSNWIKNELVFVAVFKFLSNIKLMKEFDIFETELWESNIEAIKGLFDIHPLLKKLSQQILFDT